MDSRAAVFSAGLMGFPHSAGSNVANWILALMHSRLQKLSLPLSLPPSHTHAYTYRKLFSAVILQCPCLSRHFDQCYTHTFVQMFVHVGWYERNIFVSVVYVFIFAAACIRSLLRGDVTGL